MFASSFQYHSIRQQATQWSGLTSTNGGSWMLQWSNATGQRG
jgi:hypothetical protein